MGLKGICKLQSKCLRTPKQNLSEVSGKFKSPLFSYGIELIRRVGTFMLDKSMELNLPEEQELPCQINSASFLFTHKIDFKCTHTNTRSAFTFCSLHRHTAPLKSLRLAIFPHFENYLGHFHVSGIYYCP